MSFAFYRQFLWACLLLGFSAAQCQEPAGPRTVESLLQKGSAAMQRGDLPFAESSFRAAARMAPNSAEAFLGLGLVQLKEGGADGAIISLQQAAKLDSRLGGVHLFLGIAEYQIGRNEDALSSLRAELSLVPDNVEAATWLTIALLSANRTAEAVPVIDHAADLKKDDPEVLYLQAKAHGEVVKASLAKLYQLDPDSALVHRATAESLDGSGETQKSVAEFKAAIRKQPGNPDLLEELGDEEQKAGQVDSAAATYEQVLKMNPQSAVAMYDLGRLDVERGKPDEGVTLLREAQKRNANPSPTAFYLGLGLAELGKNEEAVQWLHVSLQHEPTPFIQKGAWYQLARVYGKLDRKAEAQDALAHLKLVVDQQSPAGEETPKPKARTSPEAASGAPRQP